MIELYVFWSQVLICFFFVYVYVIIPFLNHIEMSIFEYETKLQKKIKRSKKLKLFFKNIIVAPD